MAADAPAVRRWLFGSAPDLLLGCGLLYAGVFLAFALGGSSVRAQQPGWLFPLLLVCVSFPHYGATILRVYEQRASRQRYAVFAVYATLAVFVAFVAGLYVPLVGSLLLTLYLTWSPWHYTGQNYGLAVMFLRRRGVPLDASTKRWLYASFGLSFALVFVAFHADKGSGAVQYAATGYEGASVRFLPIGLPRLASVAVFGMLAVAYVGAIGGVAYRLLRVAPARDLTPALALALTQALWFSIPIAFLYTGMRSGLEPIDGYIAIQEYGFMVALGHAAQYLWVTTYYAREEGDWEGYRRYLGKTLIAGVAVWTLPLLLFSPDLLGPVAYSSGLAVMIASAINVHHFILDGAIWKLRDGPIARVLLREQTSGVERGAGRTWTRRLVWGAAASWLAFQGMVVFDYQLGALRESALFDAERVKSALTRLRWIGRDDANARFELGLAAGQSGDLDEARVQFERSLELQESARGWVGIGHVELRAGHPDVAREALAHAVRSEPSNADAWASSAEVWLALGDVSDARRALAEAVRLAPHREDWKQRLAGIPAT